MLVLLQNFSSTTLFQWGGRPWMPGISAGTEARPTDILQFLEKSTVHE